MWKRIVVIAAGPAVNFVIAFLILWGLFASQGVVRNDLRVADVDPAGAAQTTLQPGDHIVSVDGRPGYAPGLSDARSRAARTTLRAAVGTHRCAGGEPTAGLHRHRRPPRVVVERDGARRTVEVTPRYNAEQRQMLLGFAYGSQQDVGAGRGRARCRVETMWTVTTLTGRDDRAPLLRRAGAQARSPASSAPTRPRASPSSSTRPAPLRVLALISLSLAVVNLFPFLPLDGGHIFWALAEKVRGRPIPFSVMERASVVGFVLVAILFVIGLTNDIGRLQGDGFGVR